MNDLRRCVITAPGTTLLTCTPSLIPCSAKAFAKAIMAALIVATAAKPGFGSKAALPEIRTTDPLEALRASYARTVKRRAPRSFSSRPSCHCSSVISNRLICGTAPAIFDRASILPKRSSVFLTKTSADSLSRRSRENVSGSAPLDLTFAATSVSASPFRAARAMGRFHSRSPAAILA